MISNLRHVLMFIIFGGAKLLGALFGCMAELTHWKGRTQAGEWSTSVRENAEPVGAPLNVLCQALHGHTWNQERSIHLSSILRAVTQDSLLTGSSAVATAQLLFPMQYAGLYHLQFIQ